MSSLQNVDPLFILEPIVVIGFSLAAVVYWHRKHPISLAVLVFSLLAYGGAIVVKLLFQYVTGPFLLPLFSSAFILGFYLGIQTVVFEVGGAFLVARFAVARGKMRGDDAVGYGLGLALWENAGLLGILSLINVLYYAAAIYSGGPMADYLYNILSKTQPQLFYSPIEAFPLVGWGILERVSSLLVHLSWGYLCVRSAYDHRRNYLLLALPMGMIDMLVPFVQLLTVPIFECVIFVLGVLCLIVSLEATKPRTEKPKKNN